MLWPASQLCPGSRRSRRPGHRAQSTGSVGSGAEVDLTGYWVSLVTDDWRWRMVTPAKGDYQSVPINETARIAADKWDPAKDEAAGEQCKSYAAAGDHARARAVAYHLAGRQHFESRNGCRPADPSAALRQLEGARRALRRGRETRSRRGRLHARDEDDAADSKYGDLKVVTTHVRPGYLRKNGLPYSANVEMTEYWDINKEPNGDQWLVVTTIVHDPMYLFQDWITSPHFQREPNGSKWDPQPCSARW